MNAKTPKSHNFHGNNHTTALQEAMPPPNLFSTVTGISMCDVPLFQ
jgi:hypothetical protein